MTALDEKALAQSPVGELVTFLNEAAGYFDRRDTGGEDRAHWANVFNAENCRKAATALLALQAENERLKLDLWSALNRAERAESKADGFVMVPVEPTPEMLREGGRCVANMVGDPYNAWNHFTDEAVRVYRAMIAAAPADKVVKIESMREAK